MITSSPNIDELIAHLEVSIPKDQALLEALRNYVSTGSNANRVIVPAAKPKTETPPKPPRNGETPSIATRTFEMLEAGGKPLTNLEIRDKLKELGVDVNKKNFLTSVYTGLKRRGDLFYRDSKLRWHLVKWKQKS